MEFNTKNDVYEYIAQSSIFGNLGLFIGAGFSMALLNSEYDRIALNWPQLLSKCVKALGCDLNLDELKGMAYPEIASYVAKNISDKEGIDYSEAVNKLKIEISKQTSYYPSNEIRLEFAKYFEDLEPKWVITTNYDTVIESVMTGRCVSLGPEDYLVSRSKLVPVFHLHGIRTNPNSIVITQEDYIGLFRPNQYRQQKLPLAIKESVTLLIGYNMGDFNVLTAVDWSNNVYTDQNNAHPHGIIQFLFTDNPKTKPYITPNNIVVVEFKDLSELLARVCRVINEARQEEAKKIEGLENWNKLLVDGNSNIVKQFVDDSNFRLGIIDLLRDDEFYTLGGFMEIYTRGIDLTWERSLPTNAFYAYDENLNINLDILMKIEVRKMPPMLFEAIISNLHQLSDYIGLTYGKSFKAKTTWDKKSKLISRETIEEMLNLSTLRKYYTLTKLLKAIPAD